MKVTRTHKILFVTGFVAAGSLGVFAQDGGSAGNSQAINEAVKSTCQAIFEDTTAFHKQTNVTVRDLVKPRQELRVKELKKLYSSLSADEHDQIRKLSRQILLVRDDASMSDADKQKTIRAYTDTFRKSATTVMQKIADLKKDVYHDDCVHGGIAGLFDPDKRVHQTLADNGRNYVKGDPTKLLLSHDSGNSVEYASCEDVKLRPFRSSLVTRIHPPARMKWVSEDLSDEDVFAGAPTLSGCSYDTGAKTSEIRSCSTLNLDTGEIIGTTPDTAILNPKALRLFDESTGRPFYLRPVKDYVASVVKSDYPSCVQFLEPEKTDPAPEANNATAKMKDTTDQMQQTTQQMQQTGDSLDQKSHEAK